ncbi:MAG: hypothetical protein H5T86_11120, partial [Armatimonadetes bacterium]|nr:hypothetical protein [Armatimonadota bacterium]
SRIATSNPPAPGGPYQSPYCGVIYWWWDMVKPYVKNDQIIICPSDTTHTCAGLPNRSYQPNSRMNGVKLAQVEDVANTIFFIESGLNTQAAYEDPGSYVGQANHNGGWNIAFVDGHVKWMRGEPIPSNPNYNQMPLRYWTLNAD